MTTKEILVQCANNTAVQLFNTMRELLVADGLVVNGIEFYDELDELDRIKSEMDGLIKKINKKVVLSK